MQWCFLALVVALNFRGTHAARPASDDDEMDADSEGFTADDDDFTVPFFGFINPGGAAFRTPSNPPQRSMAQAVQPSSSLETTSSTEVGKSPRSSSLPSDDADVGSKNLFTINATDSESNNVAEETSRSQSVNGLHAVEPPKSHDAAGGNSPAPPGLKSKDVKAEDHVSRGDELRASPDMNLEGVKAKKELSAEEELSASPNMSSEDVKANGQISTGEELSVSPNTNSEGVSAKERRSAGERLSASLSSEDAKADGNLSGGEGLHDQSIPPFNAPYVNASEKVHANSSSEIVVLQLIEALHRQDLSQLEAALSTMGPLLDKKAMSFNVNIPLSANTTMSEGAKDGVSMENSSRYSPLGCAIQAGWVSGAAVFIKWCQTRNLTPQLDIDASGCATCGTNLHLAMQANHPELVQLLMEQNASVMRSNSAGLTPLEAAASAGVGQVIAELLKSSELQGGLLKLRLDLLTAAEQLPNVFGWLLPGNTSWVDGLESLQTMVPTTIKPGTSDLGIVGDMPSDWILLYQNRIMCARAHTRLSKKLPAETLDDLLSEHGFNSFAWGFSLTCLFLAIVMSFFGLLVYITFRLRVYGSSEAPMSLGDLLIGAFDPCRLADSDFDPSKQRKQLPYRSVIGYAIPGDISILHRLRVMVQAIMGYYSSWMLLFVRIPPIQDVYDEEYLSDDDEHSRVRVRDMCAVKAKRVRLLEVFLRTITLGVLAFWLVWFACRWADAVLLLLLHVLHAYFASCVACCAIPATEPRIPGEENEAPDEALDAALCTMGLFGVQQGPRWTRAISTTRSTAAPSKAQKARHRRMRRPSSARGVTSDLDRRQPPAATGITSDLNSSENELFQSSLGGQPEKSSGRSERRTTASSSSNAAANLAETHVPFSDQFQKQLLLSGVLHIPHGEFLQLAVGTIISAILAIVWLMHLRWISHGDFQRVYERISAIELFQAYGAPGTSDRCLALTAEMMLMWFCCERLHEISCLVHVAKLSVQQRRDALGFLAKHNHVLAVAGAEDSVSVHHAILHCEEVIRCSKFALELSDTRWLILRRPVEVVLFWTQLLFATSIVLAILPCVPFPYIGKLQILDQVSDPIAPMVLGLVLTVPLATTLWATSLANVEVRRQRQQLLNRIQVTLSASGLQSEEGDVEYVQLRVKSHEALARSALTWSSGREVGQVDMLILLFMSILCIGCALVKGADFIVP